MELRTDHVLTPDNGRNRSTVVGLREKIGISCCFQLVGVHEIRMSTEGVTLEFSEDAIDAIADITVAVNASVENIGARRLQTVMERVLDEVSFAAPDRSGEHVKIDADYVEKHVGDLAKNADLSRFIL